MKQIIPNYSFNPAAKTVTFTDFVAIERKRILLVVNVSVNKIIYNFAASGGTVVGNVLTVTFDTTTMNSGDELMIQYETKTGDPDYSRSDAGDAAMIRGLYDLIDRIAELQPPRALQYARDINDRMRVSIDAFTVNGTVVPQFGNGSAHTPQAWYQTGSGFGADEPREHMKQRSEQTFNQVRTQRWVIT